MLRAPLPCLCNVNEYTIYIYVCTQFTSFFFHFRCCVYDCQSIFGKLVCEISEAMNSFSNTIHTDQKLNTLHRIFGIGNFWKQPNQKLSGTNVTLARTSDRNCPPFCSVYIVTLIDFMLQIESNRFGFVIQQCTWQMPC